MTENPTKEDYILMARDKIDHALSKYELEETEEDCWFNAEDVNTVEVIHPEYLRLDMGWVTIEFRLTVVENFPPYVLAQLCNLLDFKSRDNIHVLVGKEEVTG